MTTNTTASPSLISRRCWVIPTRAGSLEGREGILHFSTRSAAASYRFNVGGQAAQRDTECHLLECRCGLLADGEHGETHLADADQAQAAARRRGWTHNPDGSWTCADCAS